MNVLVLWGDDSLTFSLPSFGLLSDTDGPIWSDYETWYASDPDGASAFIDVLVGQLYPTAYSWDLTPE